MLVRVPLMEMVRIKISARKCKVEGMEMWSAKVAEGRKRMQWVLVSAAG